MSNPVKRFEIYAKLLQILARDIPVLPFSQRTRSWALTSKLKFPNYASHLMDNGRWALNIKEA